MVQESFYIKSHRLHELKTFIKNYLPTTRFLQNPCNVGNDEMYIRLSMNVVDANKLNELFNKWYDIDNPKIIKKNFFKRLFNR
jgi:hypothetical protein